MKPGDVIMWRDEQFGRHRFWEVQGVFLGAEGQEGLIELKSLTERAGHTYKTGIHPTTFVPEPLLRGAICYTPSLPLPTP